MSENTTKATEASVPTQRDGAVQPLMTVEGLQKHFPIKERIRMEFRAEFVNLTNTPQFSTPQRTVSSPVFGEVAGSLYERQGQLVLRLSF